jgi:NAD(P)-dependent dehydrogenase (short-subunit alcohol dehydrogenase family)
MTARRGGAIVFISSIWALTTGPERAAYVTAKTALTGLARSIAVDHAGQGVRANCVAPGYVDTDLLRQSLARQYDDVEKGLESIRRAHPLGRLVAPEDIAGAVAFLIGHDARSITGQTLVVDGGVSTRFALPE